MTNYDDYGMPVGAYAEPENLAHQAWRVARAFFVYRFLPKWREAMAGQWHWRRMMSVWRVLAVVWVVVLYWGERSVFKSAVEACRWENWEYWPEGANPHRLLFVADPQLVDPHTYPGRPWPLNTLTVKFTDLYMTRTYSRIQKVLYPDTLFFLGDLFDGGREWSTRTSKSPEKQYRKYGDSFWQKEYGRFGEIFFDHWRDGGDVPRPGQQGRKVISSLPGNHDLGFGKGVQMAVRKRFNAYFGDGNRVDIIANHTFVSLDAVSLSARGQDNPETVRELWEPAVDFLDNVKSQKERLEQEELRVRKGLKRTLPFSHQVIESANLPKAQLPKLDHLNDTSLFPTILLSHVPLYRAPGTPCGPYREHWPPTPPPPRQHEPVEPDERNAIAVRGGYQYQNVLNKEITKSIAEKIGNIRYAFSGDDHDYCEVVHRGYASAGGGIREITVKSISLAMGVRKPGVQLVSLWNPVDEEGIPLGGGSGDATLQTHLCLMPDELGILIRYVLLIVVTLFVLTVRAALIASGRFPSLSGDKHAGETPLLPTTSAESEKARSSYSYPGGPSHETTSSNSSSTSERSAGYLQVRNNQSSRTRSASPQHTYALPTAPGNSGNYTYPLVQHAGYHGPSDDEEKVHHTKVWGSVSTKAKPRKKGIALFVQEYTTSVFKIAVIGLGWYAWLVWNG